MDDAERKIIDLETRLYRIEDTLKRHQHLGYDNSSPLEGNIKLKASSIISIGNSHQGNVTIYPGGSSEENRLLWAVGNDPVEGYADNSLNAQLALLHQPATTGSTNQSFFVSYRPPLWTGTASVTSGTSVLTDLKRNWGTSSLVGAYAAMYNATTILQETKTILDNTQTQFTCDTGFSFTDSNASYIVFAPTYLGAADFPWRRLYLTDDIRFGIGRSAGSAVIFMKYGSGSPEGAITANVGSLFLRTDGGATTTLYIKESGTANTGWIAK